jgi:methylenetetrahydrofolate reductase (NADPH)
LTDPASRLETLVRSGRFVVTSEVVPPRSADPSTVAAQARALVGYADAVNVTDNPRATVHMSPIAGAAVVARAGLEPTLQLTVRDRNRLAIAADLLGGWALGARNLLCLTGDPIGIGDHPEATPVHDLQVADLVRLAVSLRLEGRLPSGTEISDQPRYFVGVTDSPLAPAYDPGRLEAKLDAGAAFVMTQITFDPEALEAWAEVLRPRGVFERAAVIVGVAPARDARHARYLQRLPGVHVPEGLLRSLEEAGGNAESVGISASVELVGRLRGIAGISGVHVMGLGRERVIRQVIEGAGLVPRSSVPRA